MSSTKKRVNSREKGHSFERQIAQEMREIYDPPELLKKMAAALAAKPKQIKEHRKLLKASVVRRSEQAKGAKEPDLVIEGCPFWLELQSASGSHYNPLMKLQQAERDVVDTDSELWPVSICHQTGRQSIQVGIRLGALLAMAGDEVMIPCVIDYEDFKRILRKVRDAG